MNGPLVMLADSQLLFAGEQGAWLKAKIRRHLQRHKARYGQACSVYVGAANRNEPAFFELAESALREMGSTQCVFLKRHLDELGQWRNQAPAVILLAGGDPRLGWQTLGQPEWVSWLHNCWYRGTLLIGISAGAIHLTSGMDTDNDQPRRFLDLFPAVTLVHEEQDDWPSERRFRRALGPQHHQACLKIPMASGIWVHQEQVTTFGKVASEIRTGLGVAPVQMQQIIEN